MIISVGNLVFVIVRNCVFFAVRTKSLNIIRTNSGFKVLEIPSLRKIITCVSEDLHEIMRGTQLEFSVNLFVIYSKTLPLARTLRRLRRLMNWKGYGQIKYSILRIAEEDRKTTKVLN